MSGGGESSSLSVSSLVSGIENNNSGGGDNSSPRSPPSPANFQPQLVGHHQHQQQQLGTSVLSMVSSASEGLSNSSPPVSTAVSIKYGKLIIKI